MSRNIVALLLAVSLASHCHADDKALPASKEKAAVDLAKKAYEEQVAAAKSAYNEAIERAKKKLMNSYDLSIAAAMKRGGGDALDLANQLNDEKKSMAVLIESGGAPAQTSAAASIKKTLVGTWLLVGVKAGSAPWASEMTFSQEGSVLSRSNSGNAKGTWMLEPGKKQIILRWEGADTWDALKLPLNPELTMAESHFGPDLMVARKIR